MNCKCKPALEVRLLTGERIRANRIHIAYTYGGLIEGIPTMESNHKHLLDLPRRAAELFADFPVYVIPPEFKDPDLKHPCKLGTRN